MSGEQLFGIPIYSGTIDDIINEFKNTEYLQLFSINAEIVMGAKKDSEWLLSYKDNETNHIDGYWIKKALEWKYKKKFEKISGSDLIIDICDFANTHNKKMFLLGAKESVSIKAAHEISRKYRNIQLDRYSPSYNVKGMDEKENAIALSMIRNYKPDIIIVCLGAPKQEKWIIENRSILIGNGVKIAMGAGGTLDFISGEARRAPLWVRNIGFEWLFRLLLEPWRIKRQISALPIFILYALSEVFLYRLNLLSNDK